MFILVLGVALWSLAHLWKRIAPAQRARAGQQGRAMVTAALLLSILLMIWGYKTADGPVWWGPSPALVGINNLLVLIAFYLFAASGMKTRATAMTRHPQLIGFSLWAFAHLLVNGDLPSLVLFGGLLAWALAEIVLINRTPWTAPTGPFPARKEAMAAVGAVLVTLIVGVIYGFLGPWPFGG